MRICVIAGARPNFMKIAPLVRALGSHGVVPGIVHTGQHYDERMSGTFFRELKIPPPFVNLDASSLSAVGQIAEIMKRLEAVLTDYAPVWVIVVGDVNSTVAAAITACKLGVPVAHVEAGLRSFDRTMPEELNRVVTDAVSDRLYASEPRAVENLKHEGIEDHRIYLVGNVMIDTLFANLETARAARTYEQFRLGPGAFALATLHRPSNVDVRENLVSILRALEHVSRKLPVILPIHPRTRKRIDEFGLTAALVQSGVRILEPLGYHDTICLVDAARVVLTDSGGMQEETAALRVPCITLRENTERPITVEIGSNRLVGPRYDAIVATVDEVLAGPARIGAVHELWDGHAAERIAANLVAG
jgi:UDP-N-acetylglucosamine 2-epimerase (non-hydrolysing)